MLSFFFLSYLLSFFFSIYILSHFFSPPSAGHFYFSLTLLHPIISPSSLLSYSRRQVSSGGWTVAKFKEHHSRLKSPEGVDKAAFQWSSSWMSMFLYLCQMSNLVKILLSLSFSTSSDMNRRGYAFLTVCKFRWQ